MTEWINVPVPAQHVTAVFELIARLDKISATGETSPEWGTDELAKILERSEPTFVIVTKMMDHLAQSPDVKVSRSAIGKKVDPALGTVQGAISGLQRWINQELGKDRPKPFKISVGPAEDPTIQTEAYYELPEVVAKAWLVLRGAHG